MTFSTGGPQRASSSGSVREETTPKLDGCAPKRLARGFSHPPLNHPTASHNTTNKYIILLLIILACALPCCMTICHHTALFEKTPTPLFFLFSKLFFSETFFIFDVVCNNNLVVSCSIALSHVLPVHLKTKVSIKTKGVVKKRQKKKQQRESVHVNDSRKKRLTEEDHFPECLHVIGADIFVLEVIRMFPHITAQQRHQG